MQALLFGAWVCILKYFDWGIYKSRKLFPEDPKADFFKGIAIWAWVMVILLVLTVIFSFDKIYSRSSPWTLMVRKYPSSHLPNSYLLLSLPTPIVVQQRISSGVTVVVSVHMSLSSIPCMFYINYMVRQYRNWL